MPTTLPRRWVSETEDIRAALNVARIRWGNDLPMSSLLTLLIKEGADSVSVDLARRQKARNAVGA